jgi:hypothetical protein
VAALASAGSGARVRTSTRDSKGPGAAVTPPPIRFDDSGRHLAERAIGSPTIGPIPCDLAMGSLIKKRRKRMRKKKHKKLLKKTRWQRRQQGK